MTADLLAARLLPALSAAARAQVAALLRHGQLAADGGDVIVTWPEHAADDALRILAPRAIDAAAPPELRALFAVCGGLEVGEPGTLDQLVLHDGTSGTLDALGDDAWNRRFPFALDDVRWAPIDLQLHAFYLVDPRDGSLWLRVEGALDRVHDTRDVVEVYLRELYLRLQRFPATTPLDHLVAQMPKRDDWLETPPR